MRKPLNVPREIVLASAGSGKTYRISSRLIGLLAAGAEPDHILAATFTRKATGQILDRVLDRLAAAVLDPVAARELARAAALSEAHELPSGQHFWGETLEHTVDSLHRFNVDTLDAFFIRAAGAFEADLGLPPGWRIPTQTEVREVLSAAILEVLGEGDRRQRIEQLRLTERGEARRSVHDRLLRVMRDLLDIDEQLDPGAADPWGAFLRQHIGPPPTRTEIGELMARVGELEAPLTQNGTENRVWRKDLDRIPRLLDTEQWEALPGSGICQAIVTGRESFGRVRIDDDTHECLTLVLDAARRALVPRLGHRVRALGRLTTELRENYRRLQHERGLFDFSDITRLIGGEDPLAEHPDLYYRLDARTRHLLLDEFQDTALAQADALDPLIDEAMSDDGRAVTIVADPKQSIYGWRGADPEIVHRLRKHYDLEPDSLTTSYRSSQIVLDFVNDVFGELDSNPVVTGHAVLAPTAAAWLEDFDIHRAARTELPGYVAIEVGPADEGRRAIKPRLLDHVASRVAELAEAHPGRSIGVLTRTNSAVANLFLRMRELGLPVSVEGGNPLTDAPPCEAILAYFRLADHPGDPIAAYHVAESPLGVALGFTDHTDRAAARRLASDLRRKLVKRGYGRVVSALADGIVDACDSREARRLAQLAERAHAFERNASLRPMDFVRMIEETRVEDPASSGIRVMTVHKAKGLEFDIVVLPQLDKSLSGSNRDAVVVPVRDPDNGRITSVLPRVSRDIACLFPELERAQQAAQTNQMRDELSGLYVGLTRAAHALHLIIAPDGEKIGTALTAARIVRESIFRDGGALPAAVEGEILYSHGDPDWSLRLDPAERSVLGLTETAPKPIQLRARDRERILQRRSPSELHGDSTIDVGELLRLDSAPFDRGTLAHAWFEAIAWLEEFDVADDQLLAQARELLPAMPEETRRAILDDFRKWVAAPEVRAVLSRSRYPGDVRLELESRFIVRHEGRLMEGSIDRLVLEVEHGRVVGAEIIDYKTDRTGTDPAEVSRLSGHYAGQLHAYAEAVAGLYRLPASRCRATLVFLEAGRVIDVPAREPVSPSP